jgi:hypothetical protein
MKKILAGALIVVAVMFMFSTQNVLAQCDWDYQNPICKCDLDLDCDGDANDVVLFLDCFGRSPFFNPCPPNGPAPVEKTGQTTSYATGDDGDLEKGVAWPNPRFNDRGNGTVVDNLTGLTWLNNANCFGMRTWNNALSDSNGLADGSCGLTDGSNAGDWRLPNHKELFSLIDAENFSPALPSGHPFTNVQSSTINYWSSTTYSPFTPGAWYVGMDFGDVNTQAKTFDGYVWPVRGGHN